MNSSKKPSYLKALIAWSLPNLAAASASAQDLAPAQTDADHARADAVDRSLGAIEQPNRIIGPDLYAMHVSHSSHSSHSSHYSGSSGSYSGDSSSGSSAAPATSPPTSGTTGTSTSKAKPGSGSASSATSNGCASPEGLVMGMRVQTILKDKNLYFGAIDGLLDEITRASVIVFQGSQKLPQTGKLDNVTLAKLGIYC